MPSPEAKEKDISALMCRLGCTSTWDSLFHRKCFFSEEICGKEEFPASCSLWGWWLSPLPGLKSHCVGSHSLPSAPESAGPAAQHSQRAGKSSQCLESQLKDAPAMGPAQTRPPASLDTALKQQDGPQESCALLTGGIHSLLSETGPMPRATGSRGSPSAVN